MNNSSKQSTEPDRPSIELIYALNAVATELQKSIQSEQNVYSVFQKQVVSLGLRGGISLYDDTSDELTFKTVALNNPLRRILSRFERKFDQTAEGYKVPVANVDTYQMVVYNRQAIFVPDTSKVSAQVVPGGLKKIVGSLLSLLGSHPGIFIPLIGEGQIIGMLNMVGPNLTEQDVPTMQAFANQIAVALENSKLIDRLQSAREEIEAAYQATLEGWVHALDLRDNETEGHTLRTAERTKRLATFMGLSDDELPHLHRGALLHDIGKMAIPDHILQKPGPLSKSEWEVMKQHPVTAYNWLSKIKFLEPASDIPYCHHERWNGSGYPRGLGGEDIPLHARIFSVVDVWDAMISDRPYRKAIPEGDVVEYIQGEADTLFDRRVVEAFNDLISESPELIK